MMIVITCLMSAHDGGPRWWCVQVLLVWQSLHSQHRCWCSSSSTTYALRSSVFVAGMAGCAGTLRPSPHTRRCDHCIASSMSIGRSIAISHTRHGPHSLLQARSSPSPQTTGCPSTCSSRSCACRRIPSSGPPFRRSRRHCATCLSRDSGSMRRSSR